MTLLTQESGCKVGWEFYDNEEEAREAAVRAADHRERQLARGYDFGYLWPGTVEKVNRPDLGPEVWKVVTP